MKKLILTFFIIFLPLMAYSALIGQWDIDEGAGNILTDESGQGSNIGLVSFVGWKTGDTTFNPCLQLATVSYGTHTVVGWGLNGASAATIMYWVKFTNQNANAWFMENYLPSVRSFNTLFRLVAPEELWSDWLSSGGEDNDKTAYDWTTGVWYHITYSWLSGGFAYQYVNGITISTAAAQTGTLNNAQGKTVFNYPASEIYSITGYVSHMKIYTDQQSQAQIQATMATDTTPPATAVINNNDSDEDFE